MNSEALHQQVAMHEWFQQMQRSRDLILESMVSLDLQGSSPLEEEAAGRHLLEVAAMQRNALITPQGMQMAKAYPMVPLYLFCPAMLPRNTHTGYGNGNNNNTNGLLYAFKNSKLAEYRENNDWRIYTIKDGSRSATKLRLFQNKRSGIVQSGEPFDIRMKRVRKNIRKENW